MSLCGSTDGASFGPGARQQQPPQFRGWSESANCAQVDKQADRTTDTAAAAAAAAATTATTTAAAAAAAATTVPPPRTAEAHAHAHGLPLKVR